MKRSVWLVLFLVLAVSPAGGIYRKQQEYRPLARDVGIKPEVLSPGPLNAITDWQSYESTTLLQ